MDKPTIQPAAGRLAVLLPGLGAVATTFIAGVEAVRRGTALPIGSLTQMQRIRLGAGADRRSPLIRELLPLASLEDLRFAAWDPIPDDAYTAAQKSGVLTRDHLEPLEGFLREIRPMPAVFCPEWVRNLRDQAKNVKRGATLRDLVSQLRVDIRGSIAKMGCSRAVMIWCGSTEVYSAMPDESIEDFEARLDAPAESPLAVPPSMLYAYAAIMEGVPFANGAPGLTCDSKAIANMAESLGVPIAGKDFKSGQTAGKTTISNLFAARSLGIRGWYSTNLLGNRDGETLRDPGAFRTKEISKLGVLGAVLRPESYPELYGDIDHQVHIHYYRPRGDAKEGVDIIDLTGWLGYEMSMRISFLCRDSILAAPIVLDLALFMDLADRAGLSGVMDWLSFYFKSPQTLPNSTVGPEHALHIQHFKLKNKLRELAGEEPLTHLED